MNFRTPTITLSRDAQFSQTLTPRREPRDLATAITRLTLLQNPSRIEPRSDDR